MKVAQLAKPTTGGGTFLLNLYKMTNLCGVKVSKLI